MHIPDGFIDAPTAAGAGLVAAGGVVACGRRAAATLQDKQVPLAGLTAAFIFAVQMLNFPVASGTSGHLLGGALAAVLVGPAAAVICISVVLVVQALLFADGGLSALGLNILNMALVTAFVGYGVFYVIRIVLPKTRTSVVVASGIAAFVSVVAASFAFALEYAIGGAGGASIATVTGAMVSVHVLIGVGEGIITATTVAAVLVIRPDLVFGARDLTEVRRDPVPTPAAA